LFETCRSELSKKVSGWRWLRGDAIHLTLRFLGGIDPRIDDEARRRWAETVRGFAPFELRLGSLGGFPERGRPRILWAGIDADPVLIALGTALERSARSLGFEPETRLFRPHLTLARARRGERATLLEDMPIELAAPPFSVTEVILFQSVLDPGGARYTALERYRLG